MVTSENNSGSSTFVYPVPDSLEAIDITREPLRSVDHFYIPTRFRPFVKSVIIPDGLLKARWARLAERILADYAGESELTIIVLMNGGYKFFEDLKVQLDE